MITKKAEVIASWIKVLADHPNFEALSQSDQIQVINNLKAKLLDPIWRSNNPNNVLLQQIYNSTNRLNGNALARLSTDEIIGCAFGAIGGTIAAGYSTIRTLVQVVRGYNLGYSGMVSVARSAFRTVIGSNVAGMAIEFAFCVAGAAIF